MGPEIMGPLTMFGSVVLIVWIVYWFGARNRQAVLETVRAAMQNGTVMTPELIRALGMPQRKKGGDLRWGIILLAIAAAFICLGWAIGTVDDDARQAFVIMSGVAAFPGFVGIALIAMGVLMRDRDTPATRE